MRLSMFVQIKEEFTLIKRTALSQRRGTATRKGCHLAAIKKNNMIGKNKDLDRWYSHLRSPYERVFSKRDPRVRYRGVVKNQFAAFMQAMSFNLKRLVVLNIPNLSLA